MDEKKQDAFLLEIVNLTHCTRLGNTKHQDDHANVGAGAENLDGSSHSCSGWGSVERENRAGKRIIGKKLWNGIPLHYAKRTPFCR